MDIKVIASGSSGNAYRISDGKTDLLLDAGIPIQAIRVGVEFRLSDIAGCFITHSHQDHSKAAKDLLKYGVDIYTSKGTIDACGLAGHRTHAIKALAQLTVGTFNVLPFDVQHDAPDPLGYLLASRETGEKLLYFTDTYYIKYRFQGLTHIMCECNYDRETMQQSVDAGYIPIELVPRLMKSHMSLEHLLDMLKANDLNRVQQIYLLHLSNNNSNAGFYKSEVEKLTGKEVYIC
jgi:phosphoribosyl 1,2-cyclic phosphodiesterase